MSHGSMRPPDTVSRLFIRDLDSNSVSICKLTHLGASAEKVAANNNIYEMDNMRRGIRMTLAAVRTKHKGRWVIKERDRSWVQEVLLAHVLAACAER